MTTPKKSSSAVDMESLVSQLGRLGDEPLPEDFSAGLHRKLVAAGPPIASPWQRLVERLRLHPFALSAVSASLAAVLAITGTRAVLLRKGAGAAGGPGALQAVAMRVPSSKVALVKIDFIAEREIEDVDFEITLPDGLRFVSEGEQLAERTFRWRGKMSLGSNPIPIAVKGPQPGRYRVIAHAVGEGLDVMHEVWLEVTS